MPKAMSHPRESENRVDIPKCRAQAAWLRKRTYAHPVSEDSRKGLGVLLHERMKNNLNRSRRVILDSHLDYRHEFVKVTL